jgi:hypothetical protein
MPLQPDPPGSDVGRGNSVATVHVFVSTGRFRSADEVRAFVDETYDEDGEGIPSPFMAEVGLTDYEPACIEVIHRGHPVPLAELLAGASYAEQWFTRLPADRTADAAVCLFAPNVVEHPEGSSLEYCGAFEYRP